MRSKPLFFMLLLIYISLFVPSCAKSDYSAVSAEGVLPDIIMENAVYLFGKADDSPLVISAAKITVFSDENEVFFENISFEQKDGSISGSCSSAHSEDGNLITLSGDVKIFNRSDDVEITAEELAWDDENKEITSDGTVHLVFESENSITAEGFSAKINENEYVFRKITEGRFEGE